MSYPLPPSCRVFAPPHIRSYLLKAGELFDKKNGCKAAAEVNLKVSKTLIVHEVAACALCAVLGYINLAKHTAYAGGRTSDAAGQHRFQQDQT